MNGTLYRFQDFELDPARRMLRRGGERVPAQPKGLSLLLHLVRHRDRLVTRDELFATLWPGQTRAPESLDRAVRVARRALRDSYGEQRFIRTVRGTGFRFVAEVHEETPGTTPAP